MDTFWGRTRAGIWIWGRNPATGAREILGRCRANDLTSLWEHKSEGKKKPFLLYVKHCPQDCKHFSLFTVTYSSHTGYTTYHTPHPHWLHSPPPHRPHSPHPTGHTPTPPQATLPTPSLTGHTSCFGFRFRVKPTLHLISCCQQHPVPQRKTVDERELGEMNLGAWPGVLRCRYLGQQCQTLPPSQSTADSCRHRKKERQTFTSALGVLHPLSIKL